jgi:hypothetical protein
MFPLLLSDSKDIFNADESGLFFSILPEKTYAFKDDSCHRGKRSKDAITVLVCANMDGCGTVPLLVTGKSEKPRCFKHMMYMHMYQQCMYNLRDVHGFPNMFGKKNGFQKPESTVVLYWCAPPPLP